ncbi:MAG: HXXEE domain-containing protein [Variovorax sp.]|nr:MAG: HXXEE domain-containing protein [Variovorax sp.]
MLNEVFNRRDGPADRYPLNQANCALINITAWLFYVIPVFFPDAVWLGLAQVLFGMVGQFVVHGVINFKLKTVYNPGLAAVVVDHIPLGIWYLIEVYSNGLVRGWDWLFGVLTLAAFVGVVMLRLGYGLMADKKTRYPLEPPEMARWDRVHDGTTGPGAPINAAFRCRAPFRDSPHDGTVGAMIRRLNEGRTHWPTHSHPPKKRNACAKHARTRCHGVASGLT